MPHPVVYLGNLSDLARKWDEQRAKDWAEDEDKLTFIANGQCARLPQALASVGHTSRWQRGDRVADVARTLRPGTVIANFKLVDGKWKYPNEHGYHAAIFVRGEGYSVETGKPSQIVMFDQWIPGNRPVRARTDPRYSHSDNANEFFVDMPVSLSRSTAALTPKSRQFAGS